MDMEVLSGCDRKEKSKGITMNHRSTYLIRVEAIPRSLTKTLGYKTSTIPSNFTRTTDFSLEDPPTPKNLPPPSLRQGNTTKHTETTHGFHLVVSSLLPGLRFRANIRKGVFISSGLRWQCMIIFNSGSSKHFPKFTFSPTIRFFPCSKLGEDRN
jgi:hypothetical protein